MGSAAWIPFVVPAETETDLNSVRILPECEYFATGLLNNCLHAFFRFSFHTSAGYTVRKSRVINTEDAAGIFAVFLAVYGALPMQIFTPTLIPDFPTCTSPSVLCSSCSCCCCWRQSCSWQAPATGYNDATINFFNAVGDEVIKIF